MSDTAREQPMPVVGVMCAFKTLDVTGFGPLRYHAVFERYVEGVLSCIDAAVVLIPAIGRMSASNAARLAQTYVDTLDGVFLPGAISNVDPALYGSAQREPDPSKTDLDRDATVMPLVRAAVGAGVPVLGICRGMQELNVALGGTLHPALHEVQGRRDHRSRKELPFGERYRPSHALRTLEDGALDRILRARGIATDDLRVNSLHGQGVAQLGSGVVAEAWAEDGTVEAIRVADTKAFAMGVQWHLEWHVDDTPLHAAILGAFAAACHARARVRASQTMARSHREARGGF